jgi:hypothetical protein
VSITARGWWLGELLEEAKRYVARVNPGGLTQRLPSIADGNPQSRYIPLPGYKLGASTEHQEIAMSSRFMSPRAFAVLLLYLALPSIAAAQSAQAPTLPIVVPSGPGSAPDIVARLLGDELRARLSAAVVIENRGGGGGIVAANAARSHASADALLLAQAAVVTTTPVTYKAANYDLARDRVPVAVVAETPMFFVAHPGEEPKSLGDALAAARAQPDSTLLSSPARSPSSPMPSMYCTLMASCCLRM